MRVFVTGATGVLGRRVVPLLTADGHEVTAVARGKAGTIRQVGATPVEVDLFDAPALATAVEGHDAVLDLATRIPAASRMIVGLFRQATGHWELLRAEVNGEPGLVALLGGEVDTVIALHVGDGRVEGLHAVRNPEKLAAVRRQIAARRG